MKENREAMGQWIIIDGYDYKEKLPKEDCMIWITRVCITGKRWVQRVEDKILNGMGL